MTLEVASKGSTNYKPSQAWKRDKTQLAVTKGKNYRDLATHLGFLSMKDR